MEQNLTGVIERVTFHNPENGFAVLRVQARGRRGLITVVGALASATPGEHIEAVGEWAYDPAHGEQFKAAHLRCVPPATVEGIEKYLGSGLVKGIGPHYARKIVQVFRERTLEVIDESPSFLKEVKGIGPKRIAQIRESWQQQKAVRGIMVFLQTHGIGTGRAVRIYKTYGDQAVELVRGNPYRLASDVWGFGFQSADELAGRLGFDRQSPQRARAALRYVLQELSHKGHVAYPEEAVLNGELPDDALRDVILSIPPEVLREAVEAERHAGELVREPAADAPLLYLKPLFLAELGVARALKKLAAGDHPLPRLDLAAALPDIEAKMGLELAPAQREAVAEAATRKVLVITGGPGTGKSTLVRGIVELFAARRLRVALCAPTGRAAKRLSETTGREAKTIHRLLEVDPALGGFRRDQHAPLDADLVVVDEASMVDVSLVYSLLKGVPPAACLILVGDVDQLPSVGPGRVLGDVIASGEVAVVRLTEVFRQASRSWIIRAAHAVREGRLPESAPPGGEGDFYFVEAQTPEAIVERVVTMVRERIPRRFGLDPLRDVQVLTPMNRNALGTEALNAHLQSVLNPARGGAEVQRFGTVFRVGDKVLQTQNDYQRDVYNGDVGRVVAIDETARELTVAFDGREVVYDYGELDELTLAYALSIHRSQGSEYPAVVIPLHTQHSILLKRNLLYTGLTRGKRLVAVVGSRKALEMAVQHQEMGGRCTLLRQRLREMGSDLPDAPTDASLAAAS
jgi:exodeoxyribonuclease V alpha subunit